MQPSTPLLEETSEYIKKTDLDALMGKIVSSLHPRIESIVEQAVQKAIEQATAKTDEKIAATKGEIKGEIRGEVNARLEQHLEQERQQRERDIDALRGQIKGLGDETRNEIAKFNIVVGEAKELVGSLNQDIRGWTNSLDANQRLYDQNRRDIESQGKDIDVIQTDIATIEETQVKTAEHLKNIKYAIFGGNGDGPKSLFGMIEEMTNKVDKRFDEMDKRFTVQESLSTTALELTRNTATRQDKYEQDLQEGKERWAKRRETAKDMVKQVVKTPYFWVAIFLAMLVIVSIFNPAALPILIEFIYKATNSTP